MPVERLALLWSYKHIRHILQQQKQTQSNWYNQLNRFCFSNYSTLIMGFHTISVFVPKLEHALSSIHLFGSICFQSFLWLSCMWVFIFTFLANFSW